MKKYFLLACITASSFLTGAAYADYAAIAAGPKGSHYAEGYPTMNAAQNAAVAGCREAFGTSCSIHTAEHSNWYFSAGLCDGEPYTAASPHSKARANELVFIKGAADGRSNCFIFANH